MRIELEKCVNILKKGGVILYPTDTIWGIGCDATNSEAIAKIYNIKKRNDSKALISLVANKKQLKEMENDTLVKRKVIKSNPITVEYSLTQFGSSSLPIIRSLIKWGSINKRKMSRVIEKDQEKAIDLLNDEIRFINLQRISFY